MESTTSRAYVPWRAIFIIATGFGLSSTVQSILLTRLGGEPLMWSQVVQLIVLNLAYWYVPALLAPVIMGIAARYQLGRTSWSTQIAVHVSGVLIYSFIHTPAMFALRAVLAYG